MGLNEKGIWDNEDWHKAEGVIPQGTNSALAPRDYTVPCRTPSQNLIAVVAGYWIWWCSTHHQPLSHCDCERDKQDAGKGGK